MNLGHWIKLKCIITTIKLANAQFCRNSLFFILYLIQKTLLKIIWSSYFTILWTHVSRKNFCCANGKIDQITYIIKTTIGCGDASLNFDHNVLNHIFLNHRWRCFFSSSELRIVMLNRSCTIYFMTNEPVFFLQNLLFFNKLLTKDCWYGEFSNRENYRFWYLY